MWGRIGERLHQWRAVVGVGAVVVLAAGVVAFVTEDEGRRPRPTSPASTPVVAAPDLDPCADRSRQVPGDPYSPPCVVSASGDDREAEAARGVSDTEIVVSYRPLFGDDPAAVRLTMEVLAEYFSTSFQLHGRRLRVVEREEVDPNAFADIAPEASDGDAIRLADAGVIAVGALDMGEAELSARRPYLWAMPSSCSILMATAVSHALSLADGPVAAVVDRSDRENGCTDVPGADQLAGLLEVTEPAAADAVVADLQALGAAVVVTTLDPMTTRDIVAASVGADYRPSWVAADRLSPFDVVAQSFDPAGWAGARAVNPQLESVPDTFSIAYAAFKSVSPGEEPTATLQLLYYRLQLLAIGAQLAGPDLSPSTFEAGLRAFPAADGPMGRWDLRSGHSAVPAPTIVTWDPEHPSPMNGQPGAWHPAAQG